MPEEAPKTAPRAPQASQERPPGRPNTASERPWRPSWAQLAQKSRPEAFQRPFWTPRGSVLHPPGGRFSDSFLLSESIAKAVQWAKLVQAYAQHRFTSLCNFYMWISTATDSRSINGCPAYCWPSLGHGITAGAEILEGDVWRAIKSVCGVMGP